MGKFPFTFGINSDELRVFNAKIDAMVETVALIDETNDSLGMLKKRVTVLESAITEQTEFIRLLLRTTSKLNINVERLLLCNTDFEPEYMLVKEAARYMNLKEDTVRKYVKLGILKKMDTGNGKFIRIFKSSIDDFLGRRKDNGEEISDDETKTDNQSNPDDQCTIAESL